MAGTAAAAASGPTVTIAASSRFSPIFHDVVVIYNTGVYSKATIHGTIRDAAAGEVATLFAQEFPFKKAPVKLGSVTLKAAKSSYSFTVAPNLYTKYAVRVFASATAAKPLATSRVQAVFNLGHEEVTGGAQCRRPVCHETFHVYILVPSSAFRTEAAKHVYPYFGLSLSAKGEPAPPKWWHLNAGHASVSKPRRISNGEFGYTVSYSFTIGNDGYYWSWTTCVKDAVTTDGLGLPGSHGCGASRVSTNVAYLG